MSELSSVLNFLEKSKKGRLSYDRDWAKSPESVHRLLHELSLGFQGLEIKPASDRQIRVAAFSPDNVIIEADDNVLVGVADEVVAEEDVDDDDHGGGSDGEVGSVGSPDVSPVAAGLSYAERIARRPITTTTNIIDRRSRLVYSPVDELLHETFPQRSHKVPQPQKSSKKSLEFYEDSNIVTINVDKDEEPGNFFGVRPVQIRVNRSDEVNVNDSDQLKQYRSPFYRKIESVDNSLPRSHSEVSIEGETKIEFKSKGPNEDSVFEYEEGFIRRKAVGSEDAFLSEEAVRLKLDSVMHLVGLPPSEEEGGGGTIGGRCKREVGGAGEEETDDDCQGTENNDDDLFHGGVDGSGEDVARVERQLSSMMERMRGHTDKKNSEIRRKFEDTSARFAEEAERRYREEMEIIMQQDKVEQQKLDIEKQNELNRVERETAERQAEETLRREETRAVIQQYREHEDRIRMEAERQNRIREQTARFERLIPGLKSKIINFLDLWSSAEDKTKFSRASSEIATSINSEFSQVVDAVKEKIGVGGALPEDWEDMVRMEVKIEKGIKALQDDLEKIKQEAAAALEEAKKQAEVKAKEAEAAAKAKEPSPPAATTAVEPPTAAVLPTVAATITTAVVQPVAANTTQSGASVASAAGQRSAHDFYLETLEFKTRYVEDVVFEEKKIKTDLILVISTALNAISAQTKDHLNDKLAKLTLLLAGKQVDTKDSQICAGEHRYGIKYCTGMLAKKIVRQGEDVVCSKGEAAFPIAAVALALWDNFPDFGRLLQAYFFEFCPLLAPFCPPRLEGQSDKDYFISLGYKVEKDGIEKQDKYLKRMTGLARLFSALTAVAKPKNSVSGVHPQGPAHTWRYLANLVNTPPLPDITATILLVVLETTGNLMVQQYGDQFFKLLAFLKADFLPALEAVKTDGGPTSRLDMFLTKTLTEKSVDRPKGALAPGFIQKVNI